MIRRALGSLPFLTIGAALAFGGVVALERPVDAQITIKCWKEACVYDPDTKEDVLHQGRNSLPRGTDVSSGLHRHASAAP